MTKIAEQATPKNTWQRIAIVVGVIGLIIGAIFLVNTLLRGSGKHERAIAQAVIASIGQKDVTASFDLSQQGQVQSMTAAGKFTLQNHDMYQGKLDIAMDQSESDKSIKVPIKVAGSTEKSQIYIQVDNAPEVVNIFGAQAGETKPMLDSIARKIDSKWLQIAQQDSGVTDCTGQLFSAVAADKEAQNQITEAYIAHRFVVVKDVKEYADNTEYTVTTDRSALRGFFKSLKSKEFFKKQDACNASYDPMGLETPQPQAQQPGAPKAQAVPMKLVVNGKGLVSAISSQQRSVEGVMSASADFSYQPTEAIALPAENIVEFSSIASEVEQVTGAVTRQQQAASQQAMPSGAN